MTIAMMSRTAVVKLTRIAAKIRTTTAGAEGAEGTGNETGIELLGAADGGVEDTMMTGATGLRIVALQIQTVEIFAQKKQGGQPRRSRAGQEENEARVRVV